MTTARTPEEIAAEVAALKEIRDKPTFRKESYFGDDNDAAVTAQIETLERRYSEDDIYKNYEDPENEEDRHILDNAMAALDWMNGEDTDGTPSEGWEGLY